MAAELGVTLASARLVTTAGYVALAQGHDSALLRTSGLLESRRARVGAAARRDRPGGMADVVVLRRGDDLLDPRRLDPPARRGANPSRRRLRRAARRRRAPRVARRAVARRAQAFRLVPRRAPSPSIPRPSARAGERSLEARGSSLRRSDGPAGRSCRASVRERARPGTRSRYASRVHGRATRVERHGDGWQCTWKRESPSRLAPSCWRWEASSGAASRTRRPRPISPRSFRRKRVRLSGSPSMRPWCSALAGEPRPDSPGFRSSASRSGVPRVALHVRAPSRGASLEAILVEAGGRRCARALRRRREPSRTFLADVAPPRPRERAAPLGPGGGAMKTRSRRTCDAPCIAFWSTCQPDLEHRVVPGRRIIRNRWWLPCPAAFGAGAPASRTTTTFARFGRGVSRRWPARRDDPRGPSRDTETAVTLFRMSTRDVGVNAVGLDRVTAGRVVARRWSGASRRRLARG